MNNLSLDDCDHCAGVTHLSGYTRESAIAALESGELGCWICQEDEGQDPDGGYADGKFESGHTTCCVLYDGEEIVWDGRHSNKKLRIVAPKRE